MDRNRYSRHRDVGGKVIDTESMKLTDGGNKTFSKEVDGVPRIEFWTDDVSTNRYDFPRFISMDASPIPEPATYALLLGCLALVGVARRRARHAQVVHKKAGLPNWQPCC